MSAPDKWADIDEVRYLDALDAFVDRYDVATLIELLEDATRVVEILGSAPRRRRIKPALRAAVLARDGRRCRYCLRTIGPRTRYHLDHVIPHSAGGPTTADNLVVACVGCNYAKRAYRGWKCLDCGNLVFDQHRPRECEPSTEIPSLGAAR